MYIDYGRRRNSRGSAAAIIIIAVLALGVGFGGFFAARYMINRDKEAAEAMEAKPTSTAEVMEAANDQTGIFGLWTVPTGDAGAETETSIYDNLDGEKWMPDFVDTRTRVDAKGVYLSAQYFNKRVNDVMELLETTELNAVVVDIKSDYGTISYKMDCPLAKEAGALTVTIPDIDKFISDLHDRGVYIIARVVTMKDPVISKSHPEMCMTLPDGTLYKDASGYTWMNPYRSDVWDYLIDICRCCAEAGFDEVNLDYIRFSTEKQYKEVDFGPEAEGVSKTEAITRGVKRLCEEVKPLGIFVSCDLFGTVISSQVDAKVVGQSYFQLAQYLDYLCPMIYPSHYGNGCYNLDYPDCHPYELVYSALMDSRKVLYMIDDTGNKADVRPWLQDFTASWVSHHLTYGKEEVRGQIDATYDAGYNGWLLWNAGGNYTKDALLGAE